MLGLEERKQLFIQVFVAMKSNDVDTITASLKDVHEDDQAWILTARSSLGPGTIPFAAILQSNETFLALVKHLPEGRYPEVYSVLEDGNTPLTEALTWNITDKVQALLVEIQDDSVFDALLKTVDFEMTSLMALLEKKSSECGNKNLLEDIKIARRAEANWMESVSDLGLLGLFGGDAVEEEETVATTLNMSNNG